MAGGRFAFPVKRPTVAPITRAMGPAAGDARAIARSAAGIYAGAMWVGVVHGLALAAMPAGMGNVDRWVDVTVSVAVVGAVVRALSERSDRLVARLVAEARADTLTGLLNRRGFEERLAAEVARATRERTSLALVSLDLDHFKRVNDEQGHEAGDRALAMVGAVIADHVRGADPAARWGGEEFVVVLPGADAPAAHAFAGRDRAAVAASGTGLTASAGVAVSDIPPDPPALLAAADAAMYAAKRTGRDRTVVADGGAVAAA